MNEVVTIVDQFRQSLVYHAPNGYLQNGLLVGFVFLLGGVGLSVLGAKLARFAMTCGFVALGGSWGMEFARSTNFPAAVGALMGAFLIGIIGYQTFRFWAAGLAAVILSAMVVGGFGSQRVVPRVVEFQQTQVEASPSGSASFSLLSPDEQRKYAERGVGDWAGDFWTFLREQDPAAANTSRAIGVVALLTGLCVGLMATRWALIASTSILGTALVTSGMATLLTKSVPESYEAFQKNPGLAAVLVGAFFITSLVLQAVLSKPSTTEKCESAA